MKVYKYTIIAFIAVTLYITVLGTMQLFGWSYPSNGLIVTTIVLFGFAAAVALGFIGHKFMLRKLGVYILHVGIIVLLIGCFMYGMWGNSVNVRLPVSSGVTYTRIEDVTTGKKYSVGFEYGVYSMKVERYMPVYNVYTLRNNSYKLTTSNVALVDGSYYDFGKYGKISLASLTVNGTIQDRINLDGSNVIAIVSQTVKEYDASFHIIKDSRETVKSLKVNHPVRQNGWKIFLMGYSSETGEVSLIFKEDPGEFVTVSGIILLIVGTFYACIISSFFKPKKALYNKHEKKRRADK